jgi:predicted SAM-dependent methyltransferase
MSHQRYRIAPNCYIRWFENSVQIVGKTGTGITTEDSAGLRDILSAFNPPATLKEAQEKQTNIKPEFFAAAVQALMEADILIDTQTSVSETEVSQARSLKCLEAMRLLERLTIESSILTSDGDHNLFDQTLNDILLTLAETQNLFLPERNRTLDAFKMKLQSESPALYLNIGAGEMRLANWLTIGLEPSADLRADLRWKLPIETDSVDAVYMSYVLEHFAPGEDLDNVLSEIYRILRSGGQVRIAVPDVEKWLRAYVEKDEAFFAEAKRIWSHWSPDMPRLITMLQYLGWMGPHSPLDAHKAGYDFETLAQQLQSAGFKCVERSVFMGSINEVFRIDSETRIAKYTDQVDWFTLYVEATALK